MDDTLTVHEASVADRNRVRYSTDDTPAQPAETSNLIDLPGVGAVEMAPTLHAPHGAPVARVRPGRPRVPGEVPPALRALLNEFPLDKNIVDVLFGARDLAEDQIGTCEGFPRCGECEGVGPDDGNVFHAPECTVGRVLAALAALAALGFNVRRNLDGAPTRAEITAEETCTVLGEPWTFSVKPFGGVALFDCQNEMLSSVATVEIAARITDCVNSCAPKAVRQ